jgi:hypothetical protein
MAIYIGRREFIATLGGAAATWPLAASAQQPKQMRQIGVLMSFAANDPEGLSRAAAFENGLRKLGWIRGHNLRIEYRWAENPEVLRTDAIELVGMAPDLILANSTPVMAALQEQRHAVPIVFTQVTDPVGEGLVLNLAHPGGHLTGFTSFEFSIGTKWLETLKQVATRVTRVALVFNPQTAPFADLFWRPIEAAAPSFAVVPTSFTGSPDESGTKRREKGLARSGNARVRRGMIQLAWRFLMFQRNSALAHWFRARTENARGTRKLMIVALARKLLIALWRLVREGVVPDGVILRPTQ